MGQLSVSAFQAYNPSQAASIVPGPLALYTVNVGSIAPTQLNEGLTEVGKKAAGDDLLAPTQLQPSLLAAIEPVVIGPGGQLYLTDGHHTFTALDDSIYGASNPTVYVNVIANYSNLTTSQFFAQMQASNFLLPLNDGVPQAVNPTTGAPIPTSLTALTSDPYRGLEYSILKNKNAKLFPTTSNITGAIGSAKPGLDKMTGFYSDFLEAAAYRSADAGLGLPYLSPGDIALATQWNLSGTSTFTLPNVSGTVTAAQLPGFILSQNLVQGTVIAPTVISNATLANGALDGNGTFTGVTQINAGTQTNPIVIGTTNTGFIMELGNDLGFTVTLNGNNTYTGGTSILAGTLIVASDAALGAAATGATIDTTNLKSSIQAANGIVFNSLTEGNGTLQIGTTSGAGTGTFATNRAIAVGSEAATINVNGYVVTLNGALYSLGTNNVGIGNATGFSDLTIDDNSSNKGVLILATPSPSFYGNIIVGNKNSPTVRVMNDAALGNTTGNVNQIGQVELNGGTLQSGASFSAPERNFFLGGGSTIDTAGFTNSWGALSDTQRVLTVTNSNTSTPGSATFASFNVASTASLALTGPGANAITFTNGVQRSSAATLIIQAASNALGSTQKVMSGTGAASVVDGIAPAWIVTTTATKSAGPYDFVTYGTNGYVKAAYTSSLNSGTGTQVVALTGTVTASGNLAAYALNTAGQTVNLGTNTLTIGDGTAADAAGLILGNNGTISGGTLAFGGSEGVVWLGGATSTISSTITGSNGLTFAGAGAVSLNAAANVSGPITIDTGTVTLGAANVFTSDSAGVQLLDTKSTPSKAILTVNANNALTALNSGGSNSVVNIANGVTLTIGDTTNNLSSTLSSTITGTGTAAIVKAGSGLLDLSGATVATIGTISATGGALRVAVGTSGSVNYALSNGADLQFAQNGGGQYSGAVTGAGTLHLIGGTLQLTGTANTYSGGTIVETGSILDVTTANLSSTNANITDAGGLIAFDQSTSGTYAGIISDGQEMGSGPTFVGSLDKDDSTGGNGGNLTLSAVQTYTGATNVEAGTLTLGIANAVASSSGVTLGQVGGGATAVLALSANENLASLTNNASNNTSVDLNGNILTLAPAGAVTSAYSGVIADGTGVGGLVKSGAGVVVLSGADTYSGGTTINAGTLELATNGAAGTGAIAFNSGSAKLKLDAPLASGTTTFADNLANIRTGNAIDLAGLAYQAGATAAVSGSTLTVSSNGVSETFALKGPSDTNYNVTSDGAAGTLVTAVAPTITAETSSPQAGSGLSTGQTVTFGITFSAPVTVAAGPSGAPSLALTGGRTASYTGSSGNGTTLTFSYAVQAGDNIGDLQATGFVLPTGTTIRDSAADDADLSTFKPIDSGVTLDTTPPTLTAGESVSGLTNKTSDTISGTASDANGIASVHVFDGTTDLGAATLSNGSYSLTVSALTNGAHNFTAKAIDTAGNLATASAGDVTVDTAAPIVTASESVSGLTNKTSDTISGTVSDANGIASVHVFDGTTDLGAATLNNGSYSLTASALTNGTHNFTAKAADNAGNLATASAGSITVDTAAPIVTASANTPSIQATSASGAVETFAGAVSDAVDGSSDLVVFTEQLAGGTTKVVHSGDTFAVGTHTIVASATDAAGNMGMAAPFTFTVTPPSQSGVAEDGYISGATVFADANGNGKLDPGEASATTDAQGNFKLTGGGGPLVLIGGTDVTTGLAFKGILQAPAGSAIISPLTTIVQIVAAKQGISAAAANASVAASLGLPAGTNLTTLDAEAGAQSGNPTANSVFAAQTQAANAFSLITAAGGTLSSPAAQAAIASAFTNNAPVLTDATTLTSLAASAGVGSVAATAVGAIASSTNALVASASTNGVSGLATVVALTKVAQGSASTSLATAGSDPVSLAATTSAFTGAALAQAVVDAGGGAALDLNPALFGSITHDVTSAAGNIYALYETILGRAPDPTGFESFVTMRKNGTSLTTIAEDLLASSEHQTAFGHPSNQTYVDQVYESGLHRAPTAKELYDREVELGIGKASRADVAVDIARSHESHTDLAATFQAGVFVPDATDSTIARFYDELLGRAPDASGLAAFEASAQAGTSLKSIANTILHSSEYAGVHEQASNAQFVESLFEGAFGRHEGAGGAGDYLHELNTGTSRAAVALQIAKSPEAIAHLSAKIESGFHLA